MPALAELLASGAPLPDAAAAHVLCDAVNAAGGRPWWDATAGAGTGRLVPAPWRHLFDFYGDLREAPAVAGAERFASVWRASGRHVGPAPPDPSVAALARVRELALSSAAPLAAAFAAMGAAGAALAPLVEALAPHDRAALLPLLALESAPGGALLPAAVWRGGGWRCWRCAAWRCAANHADTDRVVP